MVNRNKIRKTFNSTSEKQDSHVKRTVLNTSMIDIPLKSFNILSKGLDYKMTQEKSPLLDISGVYMHITNNNAGNRRCNHHLTMLHQLAISGKSFIED